MLEVRIEFIPHGAEEKRELLEKLTICNSGQHPERPKKGSYVCHHENGSFWIDEHNRDDGYWPLVQKCIETYLNG